MAVRKDWRSRWFARKKAFGPLLIEDMSIRELVKSRLENAGVADVIIERVPAS